MTTFRSVLDRAESTLALTIGAGDTSLQVAAGQGTLFPASNFIVTVENEHILVTSRTGDVFTITRAQEGTSAAAHNAGVAVELRVIASLFTDVFTAINNIETGTTDLTTYAKLAGRSGGQVLKGGTQPSDNLDLWSTNDSTKGFVRLIDRVLLTPSATQTITAAANTIAASGSSLVRISNTTAATITLTSTPTIAAGSDGQVLEVLNIGTKPVILQDKGTLVGSGLYLAGKSLFVLQPGTVTQFRYSADEAAWVIAGSGAPPTASGALYTVQTGAVQIEWTNMPAALTELFGLTVHRTKIDLTNASQVRLVVDVQTAGAATAVLRAQYSTDSGATWHYMDGATGPEASLASTGVIASTPVALEAGAKADVLVRVVGINGDGVADPALGLIQLQFDAVTSGGGAGAPTTSKYVLTASDAQLTNGVVRQWLGNYFEDNYPGSPPATNDEFDDTSGNSGSVNGLNGRWTWLDQATSTITYQKAGWADLAVPQNTGDHVRGVYQTAPAGNWTVEMKCTISAWSVNFALGGIMLRDGAGGVIYTLHIRHSGTTTMDIEGAKWTNTTTFSTAFYAAKAVGVGSAVTYFRVSYTSASKVLDFYVSHDGIGWQYLATLTASATITQFGFFFNETNNMGSSHLWVDYFRQVTYVAGGPGDA